VAVEKTKHVPKYSNTAAKIPSPLAVAELAEEGWLAKRDLSTSLKSPAGTRPSIKKNKKKKKQKTNNNGRASLIVDASTRPRVSTKTIPTRDAEQLDVPSQPVPKPFPDGRLGRAEVIHPHTSRSFIERYTELHDGRRRQRSGLSSAAFRQAREIIARIANRSPSRETHQRPETPVRKMQHP
jgi:hypothetical protein